MLFKRTKLQSVVLLAIVSALGSTSYAQPISEKYTIVAPKCLTQKLTAQYQTISTLHDLTLLQLNDDGLDQLIAAKIHQAKPCGGFVNVTAPWKKARMMQNASAFLASYLPAQTSQVKTSHYSIRYTSEVNALLAQLNPQEMWGFLTTLTSFKDRYANSDNGVKAADWFKSQVTEMAANAGRNDVTVWTINTGIFYKQPSVVMKLGSSNEPGIVIGGHMDTLNSAFENKPGADDDGTGSVTVLEVARTILNSNMHFNKPIYFVWYAAEEEGLVGSQYVVAQFKTQQIPVAAVIHFDMTGYEDKNDPTMWLLNDFTNKDLNAYLEKLIGTYVKQPVKYTQCGYACSDHASWTKAGYPAAIAFETQFGSDDPYIHTAQDTMSVLSLSHMTDYAKLGVAFVTELAEPV